MSIKKRVAKLERKARFYDELIIRLEKDDSRTKVIDLILDEFEEDAVKRELGAIKDTHKISITISLVFGLLAVVGMLFSFQQSR